MICALTAAHQGFSNEGARAFSGPPAFYTSRECHIAWLKIAHQAGIGRGSLRLIDTDGGGRMDPEALARAIAEDRARGAVPIMVVATAGTTGGGMIDPLHACADIAAREHFGITSMRPGAAPRSLPSACAPCCRDRARGLDHHRCA